MSELPTGTGRFDWAVGVYVLTGEFIQSALWTGRQIWVAESPYNSDAFDAFAFLGDMVLNGGLKV